jgi:uridine kinase
VEGILTLYDPSLLEQLDVRIYVEADADERILRRLRRDVVERGRDIDGIIEQYLTTVKPMHARYVEPTRALADLVINSGLNDIALDVVSTKIQALIDSQTKE